MTPSLRRLTREQADLLKNPDPTFHAAPISASNLYDWHFTLQGPPAPSPYSEGIYHGRIVLPPTYPLRPPSFRFLTPSGRFEVNREICLSISGHHEETWQPAWGIRTALIALRSFMDGDARGQVGGLDVGEEVRRRYAVASRGWRCEGCKGQIFGDEEGDEEGEQRGRTNLEVLEAWWGFCRERGVDVSGSGGGKTVEGEGEGEEGEGDNADLEEKKKEEEEQEVGKGDQELEPPTIGSLKSDTGVSGGMDAQTLTTTSTTTAAAAASTPTSTSQFTAVQQQSDQTPRQRQILLQPQPQPQHQHQQQQQISPDTPWLDRAIVGVIVALVVMILRRIARDE